MLGGRISLVFLSVVILNISFVSASIIINEVMPNPIGQESANEWVEIYSTQAIEIANWSISDSSGNSYNFSISLVDFAVLSCNNASFFQANPSFNTMIPVVNLSCRGNGWLNNGDDAVIIYDSNMQALDNFSYSSTEENKTYARISDNWTLCSTPTPGTANNCPILQPNQPPAANFTFSPQNPAANQAVAFDAGSSYDSDGIITLYSWNFGDSTNTIGITAQHNFSTAGNFTVNLTVTDSNNSQASTTKTISIAQNQSQQNQTNQTQNCTLEITYAPSEAYFGSEIQINLSVYRNNTARYAVYLYIEDNEGEDVTDRISFHADNKSSNHTFATSLEIDKKCNVSGNATFWVMLEGLDEKINKSITIRENATLCLPDFQYIISPVTTAIINETFSTRVRIVNNKNSDAEFDVWAYVYRGSKCYSCTSEQNREENRQHITVNAKTPAEFLLENSVNDAEPGSYSLKVEILREGIAAEKEYIFPILLETRAVEAPQPEERNLNAQTNNNTNQTLATGNVIYKSKFEFNKNYTEVIFISTVILAALYFMFRQKIIEIRENGV